MILLDKPKKQKTKQTIKKTKSEEKQPIKFDGFILNNRLKRYSHHLL